MADSNVIYGPHHVCITCFRYRQKYQHYYSSWLWWTGATLGLGFFLTDSVPVALLFAISTYLLSYLAMVLHELGHFFAACAVGVHVPVMSFGGGLRAKVIRFRDMFLILSPTPSEGLIILAYSALESFRKKTLLILAAGPFVSILAGTAGLSILITIDDLSEYARGGLILWTAINFFLGIVNLFPFSHKTAFGEQQSDGAQIWGLRHKTDEEINNILRQRNVLLASLEFYLGDMVKSLSILEQELEQGDRSIIAQSMVTAILAENGQLERGIELGRKFLENVDLGMMEKAILQNNLAFTLFLAGDDSSLDEADELSAIAIETLPMILAVKSTRASVLIAKGRYEEGVALLTDKRFRLETSGHQATVNSMRARGLACLGERKRASRSLSTARSLDPANRHLRAAEAAIAAMDA